MLLCEPVDGRLLAETNLLRELVGPLGSAFLLRAFVEDGSAVPAGVFAGYVDVTYDDSFAALNSPLSFGTDFANVQSGDSATAGLIDEAGGVAWLSPLGAGERLLFEAQFVATAVGQFTFASDATDGLGHEMLAFGFDGYVPASQVEYGSVTLAVQAANDGPMANNDIFAIDADTSAIFLDVLANDVASPSGNGVLFIASVGQPTQGGTVVINTNGTSLNYTPAPSFFGEETFVYTVCDASNGLCATGVVTVDVLPLPPDSFVDANNNGTFEAGIDVALTHGELNDGSFTTAKREGGYTSVIPGAGLVINLGISGVHDIDLRAEGNITINVPLNAARDISLRGQSIKVLNDLHADRDVDVKADTDISSYAFVSAYRDVRVDAGRNLFADYSVLASQTRDVIIKASHGILLTNSVVTADRDIDIRSEAVLFATTTELQAGRDIALKTGSIDLTAPNLYYPSSSPQAALTVDFSSMNAGRDISLKAERGSVAMYGSTSSAANKVEVTAREKIFADFASVTAGKEIAFDGRAIVGTPTLLAPKIKLRQG